MPVTYELNRDLVLLTAEDDVSNGDIRRTLDELVEDPRFRPGLHLLIDDRESDYRPSMADTEEMAAILHGRRRRFSGRFAVVVRSDFHYGVGRMLEFICDDLGVRFRVFREGTSARRWLVR